MKVRAGTVTSDMGGGGLSPGLSPPRCLSAESEIKGDVLFLGYYHSAFDWNDETAKVGLRDAGGPGGVPVPWSLSPLSPGHQAAPAEALPQPELRQRLPLRPHRPRQRGRSPRECDPRGVPGVPAAATPHARCPPAQFLCEEGAGDYIARVDEPQSCSYVLTVHTTRICHHPFLRPPARAAPQPIRCQPALSPAQYVQYVRAQVCECRGRAGAGSGERADPGRGAGPRSGAA